MTETSPCLIRSAEVWGIDPDGGVIRRGSAPPLDEIDAGHADQALATRRELVEHAVAGRKPVVDPGDADGASVAVPTLDRGKVTAVTTLSLELDPASKVAFEVWTGTPGRSELHLTASRYANLDRFARLTEYVRFPKRSGLPGIAWETAMPRIMHRLGSHPDFMRATGAESEGLDVGLAIPVVDAQQLRGVLLMLAAEASPLARGFEVWVPGKRGDSLRLIRQSSVLDGKDTVDPHRPRLDVPAGDGWIGRAWANRLPETVHSPDGATLDRPDLQAMGITAGVALPVILLDDVRAVAVIVW